MKLIMKKVHLIQADITTFAVHAIVNSANKSLLGGSGLDYVIHKKAGPLMKAESGKRWVSNRSSGGNYRW